MDSKPRQSARRRPKWIEFSVALTALVVSVVSLFIAQRQTQVMDRQLAASVWPAVQYYTSNLRGSDDVITLSLENVGVGPAVIRGFTVSHVGSEVRDFGQFLIECCNPERAPISVITSFVVGRVLRPGQVTEFFTLPIDSEHPEIFESFDSVRDELEVSVCFCSVLDDCWVEDSNGGEPMPVPMCEQLPDRSAAEGSSP